MLKKCVFCGAIIADDDVFCDECGKRQDGEEVDRLLAEKAKEEAVKKRAEEEVVKRAEEEAAKRAEEEAVKRAEEEAAKRAEEEAAKKESEEIAEKRIDEAAITKKADEPVVQKNDSKVKERTIYLPAISLILGIVSVIIMFNFPLYISSLTGVIGIVLGIKGIKSKRSGTAIAGLIVNSLVLLFFVVAIIISILLA